MITRLLRLEPAVVRGLLVAITAIIAAAIGREVDPGWVDTIMSGYMLAAPLIAGLLIRRKVTSVARLQDLGFGLPPVGKHYGESA
ncbi:hypothetical protein [Nocardia sp. NPDC055049]